ncbi:hypothetical protein [Falsiruegeria litorea]|nr:hypothetical protein [Falsiruegeria litorea]
MALPNDPITATFRKCGAFGHLPIASAILNQIKLEQIGCHPPEGNHADG